MPNATISRDERGRFYLTDPAHGCRPATMEEVQAAAKAAVQAALARPRVPRPRVQRPEVRRYSRLRPIAPWDALPSTRVAAGRYAVEIDGVLRFFRVRESGRVLAQHSDDLVDISTERQEHAARLIAADPLAALVRYGREIGDCGACGRTLTNQVSRSEGIGPVCAGRATR